MPLEMMVKGGMDTVLIEVAIGHQIGEDMIGGALQVLTERKGEALIMAVALVLIAKRGVAQILDIAAVLAPIGEIGVALIMAGVQLVVLPEERGLAVTMAMALPARTRLVLSMLMAVEIILIQGKKGIALKMVVSEAVVHMEEKGLIQTMVVVPAGALMKEMEVALKMVS